MTAVELTFGPGTVTWEVLRQPIYLLGGMRALLLHEEADVAVESLVPEGLRFAGVGVEGTAEAFIEALAAYDGAMAERLAEAEKQGRILRYVAVIDEQGATVTPRTYPQEHPFARVTGADNIIAFTTERYREQPLIIQGPGAGPAVTAGGVFGDILRLATYLGAPS